MRHVLLDDALLARFVLRRDLEPLDLEDATVWTTGIWYHRLCRAVTASPVRGALYRILLSPHEEFTARNIAAVIDLPEEVGLLSIRTLGWPMAALLSAGLRLNLMSIEALAAAEYVDAEICLADFDRNRPLVAAAGERGVPVRFVTVPS